VKEEDGKFFHAQTGEELKQIVAKMSKSLKNVINPDDVVKNFGADSLRLYEMFIGPLEATKPWTELGVKGVFGFLGRVYRFFADLNNIHQEEEDPEIIKSLHQTIKKTQHDVEGLRFNTAISQMMIFTNNSIKKGRISQQTATTFARVLAPFAPHLAEELWMIHGGEPTITDQPFPEYNEEYLKEDVFEYPVSFNGKLRFKLELPLSLPEEAVKQQVLEHESAAKWLNGGKPIKIIVVKGRIINVVI
jgi:leucyl-tRNA synthetase